MTYKLNLEEQDNTNYLGDSCVFNIVDGDEITIEQVQYNVQNVISPTLPIKENESIITEESINDDSQKSKVIINKLNDCQNSKINNVKYKMFINHKQLIFFLKFFCFVLEK